MVPVQVRTPFMPFPRFRNEHSNQLFIWASRDSPHVTPHKWTWRLAHFRWLYDKLQGTRRALHRATGNSVHGRDPNHSLMATINIRAGYGSSTGPQGGGPVRLSRPDNC